MSILSIDEVIKENGFAVHSIQGTSMMPLLNENEDSVRLVPVVAALKKKDIVLFRRADGTLVLHRIICVNKDGYYIRGDNCTTGEFVRKEQIIAVAEGIYKNGIYYACTDKRAMRHFSRKSNKRNLVIEKQNDPPVYSEFLYLIALVKAVLDHSRSQKAPDTLDYRKLFQIAKHHRIAATVFPVLNKSDIPKETYAEWQRYNDHARKRELLLCSEFDTVTEEFEKQHIPYMPLKGIIIKALYSPFTREAADIDILIQKKDVAKVNGIMTGRNYSVKPSSVHNAYYKEPVYNFEMHKALFTDASNSFFKDIWERAVRDENKEYAYHMSDEDFYTYYTAHFFKHYNNGGAGLRSFADFYLIKRYFESKPEYNSKYIVALMKDAGIYEFFKFLSDTVSVLFDDPGSVDKDILHYIYISGAYGSFENSVSNGIRKQGKTKYVLSRLFPPYRLMKERYHILTYIPLLLPVFWVVRFIKFLCNRKMRDKTVRLIREYQK